MVKVPFRIPTPRVIVDGWRDGVELNVTVLNINYLFTLEYFQC